MEKSSDKEKIPKISEKCTSLDSRIDANHLQVVRAFSTSSQHNYHRRRLKAAGLSVEMTKN